MAAPSFTDSNAIVSKTTSMEKTQDKQQTPIAVDALRRKAAVVECPSCHAEAMTRIEKQGNLLTLSGKIAGSLLLGFVTQTPMPAKTHRHLSHYCSNCGKLLAITKGDLSTGTGPAIGLSHLGHKTYL